MPDLALLRTDGAASTLLLNRPDSRNALSLGLLAALHARLDELEAALAGPTAPRVLILTGEGKSFCAGMDLKEVLDVPGAPLKLLSSVADFCRRLRALSIPTIAAVNGAAIGGGCGIATVTDFAVTHADSKMGFPEVDLGVCPAVVAPWLVRRIGPGRARAVLLKGGLMSGREAHALGLVSELVESAQELLPAAQALAAKLAGGGPNALRATKALLNELDGSNDAAFGQRAAEISATVLATSEAQAILRNKLGIAKPASS